MGLPLTIFTLLVVTLPGSAASAPVPENRQDLESHEKQPAVSDHLSLLQHAQCAPQQGRGAPSEPHSIT